MCVGVSLRSVIVLVCVCCVCVCVCVCVCIAHPLRPSPSNSPSQWLHCSVGLGEVIKEQARSGLISLTAFLSTVDLFEILICFWSSDSVLHFSSQNTFLRRTMNEQ